MTTATGDLWSQASASIGTGTADWYQSIAAVGDVTGLRIDEGDGGRNEPGVGFFSLEQLNAPSGSYNPPDLTQNPVPPGAQPQPGTYNTTGDLGKELDALELKLDNALGILRYLAANNFFVAPPTATADPSPTDAPSGTTVPVPPGAIGCVIELTLLPPGTPEYGSPGYIPGVAWAVQWTDNGPLASVAVKLNPQVLLFASPLIKNVSLDLVPGAAGQITWLSAPK